MLAAVVCLVGGFVIISIHATLSGIGMDPLVVMPRNIVVGFVAIAFIFTFVGGFCAISRVPWNDDREWRRGMLLATISIAVPLIALFPMAMLAARAFFLREALSLAIIFSAALIVVDVRILKARAASFVRFTTNDTQSVYYNDSHRSVDITAAIALIGALYMLLGGGRPNIVVLAYALMILGWLGMRGRAAVAVRKQISRARHEAGAEADEPIPPPSTENPAPQ